MREKYSTWLKENHMKTSYNYCKSTRLEIDKLLSLNASIQASRGIDSTEQEILILKSKTEELMRKIKKIDPEFHDIINLT